jgi:hypothetical protein
MTKRIVATGLLALLMALVAPTAALSSSSVPSTRVVVLVSAPYLRWEDVASGRMPNTAALAKAGSVANMNVRCLLENAGQPSADQGSLMISAGTWARYDASAAAAVQTTSGIEYPSLRSITAANAGQAIDLRPGTLGQAIEDAGGVTAAIGNGDGATPSRPAALIAMDAEGRVRLGDVSTDTLRPATGGVISDPALVGAALSRVLAQRAAWPGPALIVVDPGDLSRVHDAAGGAPDAEQPGRPEALARLDDVVGQARREMPAGALLVVAAPVAAQVAGEPSGFGPLIVYGSSAAGMLTSASTHRIGLVTNADLTATLIASLGAKVPVQVAGAVMSNAPAPADSRSVTAMGRVDAFMRAVDEVRPSVVDGFLDAAIVVLLLGAAIAALPPLHPLLDRLAQLGALAILAVPAAGVLMYLGVGLPGSPALVRALFAGTVLVVWLAAASALLWRGPERTVAALALLTVGVIVVDQWLGASLSLDGVLGYSPLVGARYYGIGNETAAVLVGAAITGLALMSDIGTGAWRPSWRWAVPVAVVCVGTAAAPFLGANIGVAAWGTVAFGLFIWAASGRRIGWKAVVAILVAVVLLVAAFAALDLTAAAGSRTHLGRSIQDALRGGGGALWLLLQRKAGLNLRMLQATKWTWLFAVLVGLLALLRWRPRGAFAGLLAGRPAFSGALAATLIASVIAYFTEDSGVVVPALLLLFPAAAVLQLLLAREAGE